MRLFQFSVFGFLMLALAGAFAQSPWTRINPVPQEHTLNHITRIPGSSNLLAVGGGSTVMISGDNGVNWQLFLNPAGMNNEYYCKGTCFINENTGFLYGGWETILKTTDGGQHWTLRQMSSTIYDNECINEIAFPDESMGFAIGTEGKLFKTTDQGETWTQVPTNVNWTLTEIEFADPSTGFILGGGSQMLKTTNGGNSWEIIDNPSGLSGVSPSEMIFINSTTGFAFTYNNGSSQGMVWKTTDAGLTWNQKCSELNLYTGKFAFSDALHGVCGGIAPYYSTKFLITSDGGENWTLAWPSDLPCYITNSMISTGYNSYLTLGALGKMYICNDGGYTWSNLDEHQFDGNFRDVSFCGADTGYAIADGWGGGLLSGVLKKTVDGGAHWETLSNFFGTGAVHFLSPDTGYVAFGDYYIEIMKTCNGGISWENTSLGSEFSPLKIKFSDTGHGWICGTEKHVLKTTDAGTTWSEVILDPYSWTPDLFDIEFLSGDTVFICGGYLGFLSFYKSFDQGETWELKEYMDYGNARDLFIKPDRSMYMACDDALLKSTDLGDTWTEISINHPDPFAFRGITFVGDLTGFACGYGSTGNLAKTVDGGNTWEMIETGITSGLSFLQFRDQNNGLVFGDNGLIAKTINGGTVGVNPGNKSLVDAGFNLAPNPASSSVRISLDPKAGALGYEFRVYSMQGLELIRFTVPAQQAWIDLPLDNLKPGTYTVQMIRPDGKQTSGLLLHL